MSRRHTTFQKMFPSADEIIHLKKETVSETCGVVSCCDNVGIRAGLEALENVLSLPGIESLFISNAARTLYNILTELSRKETNGSVSTR
jgi:hypothetical protein